VLLEVGCGDGIDAMYYAAQGYHVTATDPAEIVWPSSFNPRFLKADAREALGLRAWDAVIGRFLLHAMTEHEAGLFLESVPKWLSPGGVAVFEFRTNLDGLRADHFRRAVDIADVERALLVNGMELIHSSVGTGRSVVNGEDPKLGRVVVRCMK
jgi:SAM-dependent methyltransferase